MAKKYFVRRFQLQLNENTLDNVLDCDVYDEGNELVAKISAGGVLSAIKTPEDLDAYILAQVKRAESERQAKQQLKESLKAAFDAIKKPTSFEVVAVEKPPVENPVEQPPAEKQPKETPKETPEETPEETPVE